MRRRQGFTLVELMVAMALIVFIMAILSQAFVAATTSFRDLKAVGDMAERLRSVTTLLRRELAADHFEGKKRLSSADFWNDGPPREGFFRIYQGSPPIAAPATGLYIIEGADQDGIPSFRSVDHILHFTVKLRGNQRSDIFSASVPTTPTPSPLLTAPGLGPPDARYEDPVNGPYNYQWAEVIYFLRPATDPQTGLQDNANGTPLYTLFRRQLVAVPDNSLVTPSVQAPAAGQPNLYLEVSCKPDPNPNNNPPNTNTPILYFNSPSALTMPPRRFGMASYNPMDPTTANAYAGVPPVTTPPTPPLTSPATWPPTMGQDNASYQTADMLLTDVLSFNVRVLLDGGSDFVDLFDLPFQAWSNANPAYPPYDSKNTGPQPQVFDTWSSGHDEVYDYSGWSQYGQFSSIPFWKNGKGPTIKALQITLRVWEMKTEQTRQVTIAQAM